MAHTYGIEFEVIGLDPRQSAQAVTNAGLTCTAVDYGHTTQPVWKSLRDGSLPANSSEIVSPILDDSRLNEMKTVTRALLGAGARVTRSAGFHAHLGLDGIGSDALPQLILNWYAVHSYTELLVAPSRRTGGSSARWCRAMSVDNAERIAEAVRDRDYEFANADRYFSLNLNAIARHGTVEFRLHQGTLNGAKASAWVEYLTAFANHAMQGEEFRLNEFHDGERGLTYLLESLKPHGLTDSTGEYLLARANELSERV